ncbi:2-dehydropantoate 2-reductase [alpha proteobacterium BAL199]|nr:2-dehydropantoate 2-reductase [alpha proteobacterium BAL199]
MIRDRVNEGSGMRVCVFGLGAIGGHIAARLAADGHQVSAVARGETLARVRSEGLVLRSRGTTFSARLNLSDDPAALGPQDVVISTVKTTALPDLAASVGPLLGPDTVVVFAQNGIPWWYADGIAPPRPQPPDLPRLDPAGVLAAAVASERTIGAVIHSSNTMMEPGVVLHENDSRNTLLIGRPDDRGDASVDALRKMLNSAGIDSPPVADIRQAIWDKLLVNMTVSIICLITGQRATVVRDDERIGAMFVRAAREGMAVASAHGIDVSQFEPEAFRPKAPDHMPSIRQDYDRGRPLELDTMLLAPIAFARAAGIDTPTLDALAAIAVRQSLDRQLQRNV